MANTSGASWNFPPNEAGKVIGWASDGESLANRSVSGVDIRDYGAVGDGVTDDTAAQLAAFADCSATHKTLIYPPGVFTTTAKLPVTGGFHIIGPGFGDDTSSATQPTYPCAILWTGANDGTDYMIDVKSATSGNYIYDFFIHGVALRGDNKAYGGIRYASTRDGGFGNLWVDRCRVRHMMVDCSNAAVTSKLTGRFLHIVAGTNAATLNAVGFEIFSDLAQGNTRVHVDRIEGVTQDGDAVVIGNVDSSTFGRIQAEASGTGKGLRLRGTTGDNTKACRKVFIGMYAGGDVYAEDGAKAAIAWVNSEGTSVTCEAGSSLDYGVFDRKNGRRFSSARFSIDDKVSLLEFNAGLAHTGTPVIGTTGAQAASGILFDASSTEAWQWTFRAPRRWHTGWITGMELTGLPVSAGGGDVVWQVGVVSRPLGNGLAAALNSEAFTVAAETTAVLESNVLTFTTPVEIFNSTDVVIVRLSRIGGDAADTYAGDYMVIDPRILFLAAVADSDSPTDRYQPSDDVATVTST